jgi:hypothetical protein
MRGANVHAKTEDEQIALLSGCWLAATTFGHGHTQIVQQQLMEAEAYRKRSTWMDVGASAAADEFGRVGIVTSMQSYEPHFPLPSQAISARCEDPRASHHGSPIMAIMAGHLFQIVVGLISTY